jgi:hypothetical protein
LVCLAIGLGAGLICYHQLAGRSLEASDFTYPLRAAHRLLAGLDVYADPAVGAGQPYPYEAQFPYPLPAALLALPFAWLRPCVAGAAFIGLSSALLAFACTRHGWQRLSIFLSPCYFVALSVAQWSPLAVAAAMLPALLPLALAKPNLAIPASAARPNLKAFLWCGLPLLAAEAASPGWISRWISSALTQPTGRYLPPAVIPVLGPLALLATLALMWLAHRGRDRFQMARLRVLLTCLLVPQHAFFYDQLMLWLIPATLPQSLALSVSGWVAYLCWFGQHGGEASLALTSQGPDLPWTVLSLYLPTLALTAWQARHTLPQAISRGTDGLRERTNLLSE